MGIDQYGYITPAFSGSPWGHFLLISPHHGDPEKEGDVAIPHTRGPPRRRGDVAMLSNKGSRSIYVDRFWGQVLRKYLQGIQGRP